MPYRLGLFISLIIVVPLGYALRFAGLLPEWLNDALGSVFYEVFWILLVVGIAPRTSPVWAAIGVCLVTCVLELLQLWQPVWLQSIRATLVGRLVLGNTFTWTDFPAYFIGSGLGWIWLLLLRRKLGSRSSSSY